MESGISARPAESFAKIMTILVHTKHVYRICYWEHFISFPQRLVFMGVGFNHERRDLLKSTWILGGAAAAISVWESRNALGAEGAMPFPQAHGIADAPLLPISRISANTIPAEIKDGTVKVDEAYSAVSTHLGCMLSNWDAPTKQFPFPCDDATFDPLKAGANTGGAASRMLPYIPFKAVQRQVGGRRQAQWVCRRQKRLALACTRFTLQRCTNTNCNTRGEVWAQ